MTIECPYRVKVFTNRSSHYASDMLNRIIDEVADHEVLITLLDKRQYRGDALDGLIDYDIISHEELATYRAYYDGMAARRNTAIVLDSHL